VASEVPLLTLKASGPVLSLDSNIFDANGLNLESGLLHQLTQFKEGSAEFILSEIVIREVLRHLAEQASRATEALGSAIKRSVQNGLVNDKAHAALSAIYDKAVDPKSAAKERLQRFVNDTGCAKVVPAEEANMKKLIRMYFGSIAPLEDSKNKKYEFPDAIALTTLEDWAKANSKKILAISKDGGWKKFAETSEWIDVQEDLPAALEMFQQHAESARSTMAKLLAEMDKGNRTDLWDEIEGRIADEVSDLTPFAEASAGYYYENDFVEMTFARLSFCHLDENEYDFHVVQIGKDKIVSRVGVHIAATASAKFQFSVRDEGDRIGVGSAHAETEVEFDAGALITLEGDFSSDPPDVHLGALELVDAIDSVDFGDVHPDYGTDE
jgi:hypothetical protein